VIVKRDRAAEFCRQFKLPQMETRGAGLALMSRRLSIGLFALPVIALTLIKFGAVLPSTASIAGKITGFGHQGFMVILLTAPLLTVASCIFGHGLREKSRALTCASGLLLNLAVTLGSLSLAALAGEEITLGVVIRVVHLNLIVTSLFSIAWM